MDLQCLSRARLPWVVKYDCLQCKHTPVHKAITSRAMATMIKLHVDDEKFEFMINYQVCSDTNMRHRGYIHDQDEDHK